MMRISISLSEEDEVLITKSIELIKSTNKASTSFLQRNFQVGYNKAARIMEALEQRGVVSPPNHAGKKYFNQSIALLFYFEIENLFLDLTLGLIFSLSLLNGCPTYLYKLIYLFSRLNYKGNLYLHPL